MSKVKEPTCIKQKSNFELGYSSGRYFYIMNKGCSCMVQVYLPRGTKFFSARSMMLKVFDTICKNV